MKMSQNWLILIAILLGVAAGTLGVVPLISVADIISSIFVKTLQLLSAPIIFLSIIATLSGMESIKQIRRIGFLTFKYTFLTTLGAALVAFVLFILVGPVGPQGTLTGEKSASLIQTMLGMFPSNFIQAFAENNVIGIVLIGAGLGFAILSLPEKQREPLSNFFGSLFAAFLKFAGFIIKALPFGIWAMVTLFVRDIAINGWKAYESLLLYFCVIVGANVIQAVVVLPIFLKMKGFKPLTIAKGVIQALSVAFFSKSSNATLPITMSSVENNLGVPRKITSFTLPLCSTINMNGCAAFIFTTVLFVSISAGYTYSIFEMFLWTFVATLTAIGNAGVPMGCYFLSGALLSGMGVDLGLLGLILPMYALIDMFETALNVWSDCCVTVVVSKEELKGVANESYSQ